ncbi:hypothetical protein Fmac_005768 [Flemingia macrophylla]|uniref:Uncharacterized protein n=1 Tax=Flemingia macrophylla TaxID=520843 RepID=A0ABD1N930_9FABA
MSRAPSPPIPSPTPTATSATALTSSPSPLSLSCPFTPRDLEADRCRRRDNHHDWPFSSPLTCHPSGVSPSLIIPLEKTLNLSRGLKKAKKERGCTAKERISKMPPCAVSKWSSIYRSVTRHRWTGCYEAHLWDKITWNQIRRENKRWYAVLPSVTYQSYGHGGASNDVLDFRMRKKKRTGKDFVKAGVAIGNGWKGVVDVNLASHYFIGLM